MKRVTIRDIAEQAGVSNTAVSFAFNDPGRLSEETVQRILDVAEELGYAPDPIARSMQSGRTGTLGVLVPQPIPEIIRNPFLPEFLEGVGEVCTAFGYSLMIVPPLKGSVKRAITNAAVDGFLTLGLELFKATMVLLSSRGVPYVMVDGDPIEGVPIVNVDDESGARSAMRHVLEAGHQNITILSIRSGQQGKIEEYAGTLRRRIDGYISALGEWDLDMDHPGVSLIECSSTAKGGRSAFQRIWKRKVRPTALVAMSDSIAIGVISAAHKAGVQVPQDLSIVGFDDIPVAEMICPPLTTVAQPLRKKGKIAAEMLVELIEGNGEPVHRSLPTRLKVRDSVCPPRKSSESK